MAITNFSELQTAIANWTKRTDQTALLPDFITLAENKLNRLLRTRQMETSATITPVSAVAALPADYLELRRIYLNTTPAMELEYLPPEQFYLKFPNANYWFSTPSRYFTIEGSNIILSETATQNDIKVLYYAKIPALTVSNTTNWLLTAYPDIYLAASLSEAADNMKNEAEAGKWMQKLQMMIDQLATSDKRGKYSGSEMRVIAA